mmetsp:Transcript_34651/g.87709  ORF Transcript_34651/g.87709 Transcript_34651/m.87709 type:complete len:89 (-) Transcript_34651:1590-1856(-)
MQHHSNKPHVQQHSCHWQQRGTCSTDQQQSAPAAAPAHDTRAPGACPHQQQHQQLAAARSYAWPSGPLGVPTPCRPTALPLHLLPPCC